MFSPAFESVIRGVERRELVAHPVEKAVVLDLAGARVLERSDGSDRNVRFRRGDVKRMAGLVMTHNHPGGRSLSLDDVDLAADADLVEVRAVGMALGVGRDPLRRVAVTHRLRRPEAGWPSRIAEAYARHCDAVFARNWKRIDAGLLQRSMANAVHLHEVWTRVAKELKLDYAREILDGRPSLRAKREGAPWETGK